MTNVQGRLLCLIGIFYAASSLRADEKFPSELVRFQPATPNPVFAPQPDQWDAKIRERGWILKEDDVWKLWYTGYDGTKEGIRRLGYATSKDGIRWQRHSGNPLVKDLWIEDMMVVRAEGKYWMFAEGANDQAQLLVSADGIAWSRVGQLDVRKTNGQKIPPGPYGTPTVWVESGTWYLFYERMDEGVWLAASKDRKVWTHVQDEPVLKPGQGEHDRDRIALNQIVKHQGRYYAYYHGSPSTGPNAKKWSTCIATSLDLIHWEKYAGNPLTPLTDNRSSGIVIADRNAFRLFTMHPEVIRFETKR